jgi:hypothetical protein
MRFALPSSFIPDRFHKRPSKWWATVRLPFSPNKHSDHPISSFGTWHYSRYRFDVTWSLVLLQCRTGRCGVVVSTRISYSGGSGFEFCLGDNLSWLRIWVLVPSRRVNLIKSSRAISRVRCTLYTDVSMSISVIIITLIRLYQEVNIH